MWRSLCSWTHISRRPASLGLGRGTYSAFRRSQQHRNSSCTPLPRNYSSAQGKVHSAIQDLTASDAQRRTIYALSTPPGKAGVAVIRVSGPEALDVWRRVIQPTCKRKALADYIPTPWKMERCRVVHPETQEMLDDGLAIYFRAPHSFTTEDVVELHIHSGRAIVASVLGSLALLPSCRPAEPGEFTRRAFLGGRLDLTQVEGLKDLIDAETDAQRRIALQAAGGASRAKFDELRKGIINCLAQIEALIDFGEGEDIEEGVYDEAGIQGKVLLDTMKSYLNDHRRGELMRSGLRLAIFGPPNAGKSSLLNFLAQREAAIVTSIPGTTRDILELSLDIGGLPVIVADTAGLRHTEDVVESIGVERARNAVKATDIALCVLSLPETLDSQSGMKESIHSLRDLISPETFFLFNKSDLLGQSSRGLPDPEDLRDNLLGNQHHNSKSGQRAWVASLSTGAGTEAFLDGFADALKARFHLKDNWIPSQTPLITRARHRTHLESACQFLEAFLELPPEDVVLAAEELRYAAVAVGKVTGHIDVEDILDAVFRDFCIGK